MFSSLLGRESDFLIALRDQAQGPLSPDLLEDLGKLIGASRPNESRADVFRLVFGGSPGFPDGDRTAFLAGFAGTEHRIKPLRRIKAAGLPGRYVAAYDLATGLVIDVAAGEDAYTSERELVRAILVASTANDLFVADRHFCTTEILFAIADRRAHFVIRQHTNLRWRPLEEARRVSRVATGEVWEQLIRVEDT